MNIQLKYVIRMYLEFYHSNFFFSKLFYQSRTSEFNVILSLDILYYIQAIYHGKTLSSLSPMLYFLLGDHFITYLQPR